MVKRFKTAFGLAVFLFMTGCAVHAAEPVVTGTPSGGTEAAASSSPVVIGPRAIAGTPIGTLKLMPLKQEDVRKQEAPSCYGLADDYFIDGEYRMVLEQPNGKNLVVQEIGSLELTAHSTESLKLQELAVDETHQLYILEPRFTDCHAIEFRAYMVDGSNAYAMTFLDGGQSFAAYSRSPGVPLAVQDGKLIVESALGAGIDHATRFTFMIDWGSHAFVLEKKEQL